MTAKFLRGSAALWFSLLPFPRGPLCAGRNTISPCLRRRRERRRRQSKPAPKINKAEEDAYKAFYASRTADPQLKPSWEKISSRNSRTATTFPASTGN